MSMLLNQCWAKAFLWATCDVALGPWSGPHRVSPNENGGKTLGMGGPLIVNPLYTLEEVGIYSVYPL